MHTWGMAASSVFFYMFFRVLCGLRVVLNNRCKMSIFFNDGNYFKLK